MNCNIHVYLLNDDFSIEHAEANFGGKESEMNRRYEWEDELSITTEVLEVSELENAVYTLQGNYGNGESFRYDVSGMRLFEVKSEEETTVVGCSESILDRTELTKRRDTYEIEIYLKDYEPMANPVPGIYIASKEFPKELIVE